MKVTALVRNRRFSLHFRSCSFVWYKNLDRYFYRFVTIHACDRQTVAQTDRQTEFSSLDRVCIPCSAVKNAKKIKLTLTLTLLLTLTLNSQSTKLQSEINWISYYAITITMYEMEFYCVACDAGHHPFMSYWCSGCRWQVQRPSRCDIDKIIICACVIFLICPILGFPAFIMAGALDYWHVPLSSSSSSFSPATQLYHTLCPGKNETKMFFVISPTRCSAIADKPRCRVR